MRQSFNKLLLISFSIVTFIFLFFKFSTIVKSQCVPACTWGWCSMDIACCECLYGWGSYGPVQCCAPPDHTGCSTYNVGGCAAAPPPEPTSTPACPTFVAGSCNPSVLNQGQPFRITCDFGRLIDCIGALPGCTFIGWIGTTTQAEFSCVAPMTPGNITNYCGIYSTSMCPGCSGSWTGSSCSVSSSVPNCSNVTGPTNLSLGQSGTYSANLYSPGTLLGGEINYFDGIIHRILYSNFTPPNAVISTLWTPPAIGNYSVCCRAWNGSVAECRPPSFGGIVYPVFACSGPNYCLNVSVTAPTPTPTSTPRPTSTPTPRPTSTPTSRPTSTPSPTPTNTPTPTRTPTPTPTNTPIPTSTPRPTNTPTTPVIPTSTPLPTPTPTGGGSIDLITEGIAWERLYRAIQPVGGPFYFSTSLTLGSIISVLLRYLFPILALIFILMIIYGGFKFMTSTGNPQAIQGAKSVIITAFLGFIIIFLSYWITKLIANILGLSEIGSIF